MSIALTAATVSPGSSPCSRSAVQVENVHHRPRQPALVRADVEWLEGRVHQCGERGFDRGGVRGDVGVHVGLAARGAHDLGTALVDREHLADGHSIRARGRSAPANGAGASEGSRSASSSIATRPHAGTSTSSDGKWR